MRVLFLVITVIIIGCSDNALEKQLVTDDEPSPIIDVNNSVELKPDPVIDTIQVKETGHPEMNDSSIKELSFKVPNDYDYILSELREKDQEFVISTKRDTTVEGILGTKIYFPSGCFNAEMVKIILTEVYSNEAVFLNELSTVTKGGDVLSTKGMVKINACSSKGKEEVVKGKSYKVYIPKKEGEYYNGDYMFDGERDKLGEVVWTLNQASVKPQRVTRIEILTNGSLISFGLGAFLDKYGSYSDSTIFEYTPKEQSVLGKREIPIRFRKGKCYSAKNSFTNRIIKWSQQNDSLFYKGYERIDLFLRSNGKEFRPLNIREGGKTRKEINSAIEKSNNIEGVDPMDLKYYVFNSDRIGWINCDKFANLPDEDKQSLIVQVPFEKDLNLMLFLKEYEASLRPRWRNGRAYFENLPKGVKGKLFAGKIVDGQLMISQRKIENSGRPVKKLKFRKANSKELASILKNIRKY